MHVSYAGKHASRTDLVSSGTPKSKDVIPISVARTAMRDLLSVAAVVTDGLSTTMLAYTAALSAR